MKNTAIEWLLEEWPILVSQIPPRIIDEAKEIEAQQIIDAYYTGADEESDRHGAMYQTKEDAKHYYYSTFNNTQS